MTSRRSRAVDPADGTPASAPSRPGWTRWIVPYAAVSIAVLALVAAYVTSHRNSPARPKPPAAVKGTGAVAGAGVGPEVVGAFPFETGPRGAGGQWMGDSASVNLNGAKQAWIGFRAQSLGINRTLTIAGAGRAVFRVGTRPRLYLVGPLSGALLTLRAAPAAAVPSSRDPRRLSIFLSTPRAFSRPVAAVPGPGFWPNEHAGATTFNWLRGAGDIDVYAAGPPVAAIWLTFMAASIGGARTLVARSGGVTRETVVPTASRFVRLGPFRLVGNRARIALRSSPGPRRYGVDPRLISVQVGQLAAHTSASES